MGFKNFNQLIRMDVNWSDLAGQPNMLSNDVNTIIGFIEDIVVSDSFQVRYKALFIQQNFWFIRLRVIFAQEMQTDFFERHCMQFTNEEENKIIYTDIFNEYTRLIEEFILTNLRQRQPNIDINLFLSELRYRLKYF